MSQLPGSPAYGLATSDPPRDRTDDPWPAFWLGALSWVVNGYALAFAALVVVLGRAADRIGRRRVYLAGVPRRSVARRRPRRLRRRPSASA